MGDAQFLVDGSGNLIGPLYADTSTDGTGDAALAAANSDTGRFISIREGASGLVPYDEAADTQLGDWNLGVPVELGSLDTPYTASNLLSTPIPRADLSLDRSTVDAGSATTTSGEDMVRVTSAGIEITLADADAVDGRTIAIKDKNADVGTNANVTIDTGGSQDVEATKGTVTASGSLPTDLLTTNSGAKVLQFDGATSTWRLVSAL